MQDDFPLTITSILLAAEEPCYEWPELDERSAAAMCYTDEKWTERPLACVVVSQDTGPVTLAEFLDGKVAHWQVPENWAFIEEVPETTVGKFDKKVLRARYRAGELDVKRTHD